MRTTLHKFLVVSCIAVLLLCVVMCAKAADDDKVISAHDWSVITMMVQEQNQQLENKRQEILQLRSQILADEKCIRSHVKQRRPVLTCYAHGLSPGHGWHVSPDREF